MIQDLNSTSPFLTLNSKQVIPICGMSFSPQNKNEIYLGYSNNIINIFDLAQRKISNSITTEKNITCFSVFENGFQILIGSNSGRVYQYDTRNSEKPVDVLQCGTDQIDFIDIQNGNEKVIPDTTKQTSGKSQNSIMNFFTSLKKPAKETNINSSRSKGISLIK